jgi:hypothetical protein
MIQSRPLWDLESKNPFVSLGLGHNGIPWWAELIFLCGPPDFYSPLSAHSAVSLVGIT